MRAKLGAYKTGLSPPPLFYNTDRSKAIRLLWLYLFYFGVDSVLFEQYVRFHILVKFGKQLLTRLKIWFLSMGT